jgi:LuxR family maltose regulon positive regulatory protein
MSEQILLTKLFVPTTRGMLVLRNNLFERLNHSLLTGCKLTLISAPAGFGKSTLISSWIETIKVPIAWLSLDERDNDPARFITYLTAALQKVKPGIGQNLQAILQSPQPLQIENTLILLINDISSIEEKFVVVLEDYHLVDSQQVDQALEFLISHQPPCMHLVIVTREDPNLPLARLRAQNHCIEFRAADLRFSNHETEEFFNRIMQLNLSKKGIDLLELRTEGWIAGMQMAAISMQGLQDTDRFIQNFTDSNRFVMDYLLEEVLHRQPENIQDFLQRTSILDRMCGSLCDAILQDTSASSKATLEYLERVNLFIIPQDNERQWYRYHHLFRNLLLNRLGQNLYREIISELHIRASEWFEQNGSLFEAFQHATAANDVERAERLIETEQIGLHLRSVAIPVLNWLNSLPKSVLDTRPRLWVRSATTALVLGLSTGVEEKLQAAEAVFTARKESYHAEESDQIRDLIGQIACARATLALFRYDPAEMIIQARRALEYLHSDNLTYRFTANWALTSAFMFQGDRAGAAQANQDCIEISQKSGHVFSKILAASNMGSLQEMENQLNLAAETYHEVLQLFGDHPQPNASIALLGLARISYEWNDLIAAERYGQQSLQLALQLDSKIDRFIVSEVFLARLKLAHGDLEDALGQLIRIEQTARQRKFLLRLPEIAAAQVSVLLRQGSVSDAIPLVQRYEIPLSQARVALAQGNPSSGSAILELYRQQMEALRWADERLRAMILQTLTFYACDEKDKATQVLSEVLSLAEPGGFLRIFLDEGKPMADLLSAAAAQGICLDYVNRLLAAFEAEVSNKQATATLPGSSTLVDTLSVRELEVLRLIDQGFSNQEISERLFLALDTIKGYNRRIFEKLHVQRRTEAIARARELGLL